MPVSRLFRKDQRRGVGLKCILQVEVPFTQSTSEGQQVLRDGSRQKPVLSSYNTYVCVGGGLTKVWWVVHTGWRNWSETSVEGL